MFERFPADGAADATFDLYLMDTDGNNVKQLTHLRGEHWELASRPRWAPGGEWILFEGSIVEGNIARGRQIYAIRSDGMGRWRVSEPIPGASMFLGGWSPDGKQIVYAALIGARTADATVIIATLDPIGGAKVIKREKVPLPKMPVDTVSFGVDGKSILFSGKKALRWNIFRFRLDTHELIQLTDNVGDNKGPQEWNPRLSVPSQQGLLPQVWGQFKAAALWERHPSRDVPNGGQSR